MLTRDGEILKHQNLRQNIYRKWFPCIQKTITVYHETTIGLDIYSGHNYPCLLCKPRQMKQKKLSSTTYSTRACFPQIWSTALSNIVYCSASTPIPVSVPAQEQKADGTALGKAFLHGIQTWWDNPALHKLCGPKGIQGFVRERSTWLFEGHRSASSQDPLLLQQFHIPQGSTANMSSLHTSAKATQTTHTSKVWNTTWNPLSVLFSILMSFPFFTQETC